MLKACNSRVRMTSATANAVTNVRMVSDNPPCRRFSSLDTVVGREGSGLATRLPRSWIKRYHILLSRRVETSLGKPVPEIGTSGSTSRDGKRPLPHGLILAASSTAFIAACEEDRTLDRKSTRLNSSHLGIS